MADRQDDLGLDRERRVEQQVVRLRDGPDHGALDREDAAVRLPRLDEAHDVRERRDGDRLVSVREQPLDSRLGVRPVLARVRDPHDAPRRLETGPSTCPGPGTGTCPEEAHCAGICGPAARATGLIETRLSTWPGPGTETGPEWTRRRFTEPPAPRRRRRRSSPSRPGPGSGR